MSRCFKRYDVKHLRHGGCVPATREIVEGVESIAISAPLRFSEIAMLSQKITNNGSFF